MSFYQYEGDFNGITRHLKQAEIYEKKTYLATSSSSHLEDSNNWGYSDVILNNELSYPNEFVSDPEKYSNVSVYFLRNRVRVSSYSISSRSFGGIDKLKSWNLYGSNNNVTWSFIDEQGPTEDLVPDGSYATYNVKKQGVYRYFRLTQTDMSSSNRWYLIVSRLEFFGQIYPLTICSCVCQLHLRLYHTLVLFIFY